MVDIVLYCIPLFNYFKSYRVRAIFGCLVVLIVGRFSLVPLVRY